MEKTRRMMASRISVEKSLITSSGMQAPCQDLLKSKKTVDGEKRRSAGVAVGL